LEEDKQAFKDATKEDGVADSEKELEILEELGLDESLSEGRAAEALEGLPHGGHDLLDHFAEHFIVGLLQGLRR
jgi:hypothetical protein